MKGLALAAGGATVVGLTLAITLIGGVLGIEEEQQAHAGPIGGVLNPDSVPNGWAPLVQKAGSICPEFSPPIIAAQIEAESNWNPNAVSPVGAVGLSQFMPATWAEYGVDGNGDGVADPYEPADAILSQGNYDCAIIDILKAGGINATTELGLAAYNAGPGAVMTYQGIPPYAETQAYVRKIMELATHYGSIGVPVDENITPGRAAIIAQAQKWHGTVYSWGGGGIGGPGYGIYSDGIDGRDKFGFDCSSLMQYAFYHGTGGKLLLPRTTYGQVTVGTAITRDQLQPGDVVLFQYAYATQPHHIGMYVGNGQMVHAGTKTGVATVQLFGSPYYERLGWRPRRLVPE